MFKRFPALAALLCGAALLFSVTAEADTVEIQATPSTLNLSSNGGSFSIHAVIGYSSVTQVEFFVDGQEVTDFTTFADDRGELVVKCDLDLIKRMVSEGTATIDLVMHTASDTHTGTDTIRVINRGQ